MARKNINSLAHCIFAMGGKRIVTITTSYLGTVAYDISIDGQIGYAPEHDMLFHEHLEEAVNNGGGIIVRKFTSDTFQCHTPSGLMVLPVKFLYAASCGKGRWAGMNEAEVKMTFSTNPETYQPILEDQGVVYQDWTTGNLK